MGREEIFKHHLTPYQLAIDHNRKADVQDDVVVDGQTQQKSNQFVLVL